MMDKLGFTVHPLKSVFKPVQVIVFLGFVLNSLSMLVTVTPERIHSIIELCEDLLKTNYIILRDFARLIGKMVACEPGMQYAPLFYKDLEHARDNLLKSFKGNYDAKIALSESSKQIIHDWTKYSTAAFKPIIREDPSITLFSDSSQTGWGGVNVTTDTNTQGFWSEQERNEHINVLELTAAKFTIKSLAVTERNSHIRIYMDNTVAISYINKFGGKMHTLHCIAKDIWLWAKERNIWISAAHVPGVDNTVADALSRCTNDDMEWMLNKQYFQSLQEIVGNIDIDLFASRLNHQVPQYVSFTPDSQAAAVDAFTLNWDMSNRTYYLFPPFSMISRCVQKIVQDQVETAVLIAPLWPTQIWFSEALHLICAQSYILPLRRVLSLPQDSTKIHPVKKLKLGAFILSGRISKIEAYQTQLSTSSSSHGNNLLLSNMGHISESGCCFVSNHKMISFNHLPLRF
jgi:hypothetical protein